MAQLSLFIDASTLSQATAVYTTSALDTLAADGYYSDANITRQQLNGVLGASITCPNCSGSTPSAPTTYSVIQNVTNNIVGTLGVDYTLSGTGYDGGNPAGPVTQTNVEGYPYSFVITATPITGKQFSSSAAFSATNPSGTIPNGGSTVTNTLTGSIISIPTTTAAFYYYLNPCPDVNGVSPAGGFIYRTDANKPAAGQRFVTTNTPTTQYFYYDQTVTPQTTVNLIDQLESVGGRNLTLEALPGETECPTFNTTNENIYRLNKCSDNSNGFYFNDTRSLPTLTRLVDGSGTIYIIEEELQKGQEAGLTEITSLLQVDIFGVTESDRSNFRGPAQGCPSSYYELQACDQTVAQSQGLRVSRRPSNDPFFSTGGTDSVYIDDQGICYKIYGITTNPGQYVSSTSSQVNLVSYIGDDCQTCSGGYLGGGFFLGG